MTYSVEDIKEVLQNVLQEYNSVVTQYQKANLQDLYLGLGTNFYDEVDGEVVIPILGGKGLSYEHVEDQTGGEGEGEYCYGVFKLGEQHFQVEWSYYSHHGWDYDDIEYTFHEVKPVQKLVTMFERV